MKLFVGWDKVPEKMSTKTKLKNEYGLKPKKDALPRAQVRAQTPRGWRKFDLYHFEDSIEIKRRTVDISHFELDDQTIADALYIINKSAKVSRDTKKPSYHERKYAVVSAAKTRQLKHYDLKEAVLNKLIQEGRALLKGYHQQDSVSLLLYNVADRTFHMPVDHINKDLQKLGEIEKTISSDRQQIEGMNYNQAKKLLEKYVGDETLVRIDAKYHRMY